MSLKTFAPRPHEPRVRPAGPAAVRSCVAHGRRRQRRAARRRAHARRCSSRARACGLEHLGAYRPLVAAIREELERFVATDLRLHLAIAERDRYVLSSIVIDSVGPDETRTLLARFVREFAPEQVKHYLAREIIARLPNASAIDLTQFAGLRPAAIPQARLTNYDDILDELRSDEPEVAKPFEVTLVGRWSDEATVARSPRPRGARRLPRTRHRSRAAASTS